MKACLGPVVLLSSFGATAASFDCARPGLTGTEQAICGDSVLSARDDTLAVLYRVATAPVLDEGVEPMQPFGYPPPADLLQDQRAWLAARNRCKDRTCLVASYDKRIGELGDYVDKLVALREGDVLMALVSKATGIAKRDIRGLEVLWYARFEGNTAYPEKGDAWFDQVRSIVRFDTDDPGKPGGSSGLGWCGASHLTHVLYLASDDENRLMESAHLANNNCTFGNGYLDGVKFEDGYAYVGFGELEWDWYKPVYRVRTYSGSRWFELIEDPYPVTSDDPDAPLLRVYRKDGSLRTLAPKGQVPTGDRREP